MKKLFALFRKKKENITPGSQRDLLEFVKDKENVKKAAEGSMQKRIDLIERVELKHKRA